jgi:hypothetical protein
MVVGFRVQREREGKRGRERGGKRERESGKRQVGISIDLDQLLHSEPTPNRLTVLLIAHSPGAMPKELLGRISLVLEAQDLLLVCVRVPDLPALVGLQLDLAIRTQVQEVTRQCSQYAV